MRSRAPSRKVPRWRRRRRVCFRASVVCSTGRAAGVWGWGRAGRRRAEEAVRQGEALRGAVLESALDCVITMNHEGRIVEFNRAAEETFGYRRGEAAGRLLADVIVPPALRKAHLDGLSRYLRTRESKILG